MSNNPFGVMDALAPLRSAAMSLPVIEPNIPAKWMHERIVRSINEFEEKLDSHHEVGLRLVSFGSNEVFHIEDVGFWGPDLIKFFGKNSQNEPVELMQHYSQVSVLLVASKKLNDQPKRIGFILMQNLEEKP